MTKRYSSYREIYVDMSMIFKSNQLSSQVPTIADFFDKIGRGGDWSFPYHRIFKEISLVIL